MTTVLTKNQLLALRELDDRLRNHHIQYVIIGGLAAIAWGVKRELVDIDVQVSQANFKTVEHLFASEVTQSIRHYETEKWDIYQMIVRLYGVDIDICQAENFSVIKDHHKYLVPNCIEKTCFKSVGGISVPILPLDELIRYKQLIARPVDIDDLAGLTQLQ